MELDGAAVDSYTSTCCSLNSWPFDP